MHFRVEHKRERRGGGGEPESQSKGIHRATSAIIHQIPSVLWIAGTNSGIRKPRRTRWLQRHAESRIDLSSYHELRSACFLSASLEVHLPTVGRRALGGSYGSQNDRIVLKGFESHFPGRKQLWKSPFNVSFSYESGDETSHLAGTHDFGDRSNVDYHKKNPPNHSTPPEMRGRGQEWRLCLASVVAWHFIGR